MSSILEALRELEGGTPRGVDAPAPPARVGGVARTVGIVAVGLVVATLGGLLVVVGRRGVPTTVPRESPPVADVPQAPPPAAAPPSPTAVVPAWLATAEPPRARVAAQPDDRARPTAVRPTPERQGDAPPPGAVRIAAIHYSPDASRRAVTLQLDGATLTLRERESARGVEVQLIERDGVYVRRGGDVFLLAPQ